MENRRIWEFFTIKAILMGGAVAAIFIVLLSAVLSVSAKEKTESDTLKGRVVVIDAGHGGSDPGAIGVGGSLEKEINLLLANKVANVLEGYGAEVVMTRKDDNCFSDVKKEDLDARVKISEDAKADIFISMQCNAISDSSCSGAQVFFYPTSEGGEALANSVQESLKTVDPDNQRVALAGNTIYVLRTLSMPAVIVEAGFLSNAEEEALLITDEYQQKVSSAVAEGVVAYFDKGFSLKEVFQGSYFD